MKRKILPGDNDGGMLPPSLADFLMQRGITLGEVPVEEALEMLNGTGFEVLAEGDGKVN